MSFVFIDKFGVLKEIITERQFRAGDSKRNKLYVYYDNDSLIEQGWVKFIKANGTQTTETQFSITKVGKELPSVPVRNLEFFNYNHTYEEGGTHHIGYKFYEITIPDEVLSSATAESKLCSAIIRFVFNDGTEQELDQLGIIPFSVDGTTVGIITDKSINESQYNYLIKLWSESANIVANPGGLITATLETIRIGGVTYQVGSGGGEGSFPFKLVDETNNKNYKLSLKVKADGKGYLEAEEI